MFMLASPHNRPMPTSLYCIDRDFHHGHAGEIIRSPNVTLVKSRGQAVAAPIIYGPKSLATF